MQPSPQNIELFTDEINITNIRYINQKYKKFELLMETNNKLLI